ELAAPVSHIWYFKGIPSRMGLILDMSPRALEEILYFAAYVVTDSGTHHLRKSSCYLKKSIDNSIKSMEIPSRPIWGLKLFEDYCRTLTWMQNLKNSKKS